MAMAMSNNKIENKVQPSGALEIIAHDLTTHVDRVAIVGRRLHTLNERLFGSRPEAVSEANGPRDSKNHVGRVHDKTQDLGDILNYVEEELQRLEAL